MTTLLLIRHGLSIANRDGIFIGQTDLDLAPEGFLQAECTAQFVKENYRVDHVYASDLSRAYHTGEAVAKAFGLPVITDKRLREIYSGAWENMPYPEMEKIYAEDRAVWRNDIVNSSCTDGESVREMAARVLECAGEIAGRHEGETIVLASHATPIRALCCLLDGKPVEEMQRTPWVYNASVTEVVFENGVSHVTKLGMDAHLGDLHSTKLKK